jgi:hypothetical protein
LDFLATTNAPITVTVYGTSYNVPRFLNRQLKVWAAQLRKEQEDNATRDMSKEDKARILSYFRARPFDTAELLQMASSPEGAEYVVGASLKLAGVPGDVVEKVLDSADPLMIQALSRQLTEADATLAKLGVDAQAETNDPLPQPAGESGVSPETGSATTPSSAPPTAA